MKTYSAYNESVETCGYSKGQEVPYRNTRGNVKLAKITRFNKTEGGRIWFYGIDTITNAQVYYPVHLSKELQTA